MEPEVQQTRYVEPEPRWTKWLVGILVAIWLLMTLTEGSLDATESSDVLYEWGAAARPALWQEQQYWRLFTASFLHIGLIHLALNCFSLWSVGRAVELLFGPLQMLFLFVVSGVIGAISSAVFGPPAVISAGASGAILGLFGAILWYRLASPLGERIAWRPLVGTLVLNLLLFYSLREYLDNWNHLGGLLAGFVGAAALGVPEVPWAKKRRLALGIWPERILSAVLSLVTLVIPLGLIELPGSGRDLADFLTAYERGAYTQAESSLQRVIERYPAKPEYRVNLVLLLAEAGRCQDSRVQLLELERAFPGYRLKPGDLAYVRNCGQ